MKFFLKTAVFALFFVAFSFRAEAQGVFGESWYRGGFGDYIESSAVSPDGAVIALAGSSRIELRNALTGKFLKEFPKSNRCLQLLWSKKDAFLIFIGEEKTSFIDTATGTVFKELEYRSTYSYNDYSKLHQFSPGGKYLVIDTNTILETET